MGDYTKVQLDLRLKAELPATLRALLYAQNEPFGSEARVEFSDRLHAHANEDPRFWRFAASAGCRFLVDVQGRTVFRAHKHGYVWSLNANFKNYDAEFNKFLTAMQPYFDYQIGDYIGTIDVPGWYGDTTAELVKELHCVTTYPDESYSNTTNDFGLALYSEQNTEPNYLRRLLQKLRNGGLRTKVFLRRQLRAGVNAERALTSLALNEQYRNS